MSELRILHPVTEVQVDGLGVVEVREMRWKPALAFVEKLSGLLGECVKDGKLTVTVDNLTGIILRSGTLASELIARSTSLTAQQVDDLYPSDALALLTAAIEVNLHEELLGKGKAAGRALAKALGIRPADGAA